MEDTPSITLEEDMHAQPMVVVGFDFSTVSHPIFAPRRSRGRGLKGDGEDPIPP